MTKKDWECPCHDFLINKVTVPVATACVWELRRLQDQLLTTKGQILTVIGDMEIEVKKVCKECGRNKDNE